MADDAPRPDTTDEIMRRIPHRPPMLLIDEIVEETDSSIHCRKQFTQDDFFVQGHYPGRPIVPGVILCECAAQAGALLLSGKIEGTSGIPVLTRISDTKFKQMVSPPDTVDIVMNLDERLANAFFLSGHVRVGTKTAVRVKLACALAAET